MKSSLSPQGRKLFLTGGRNRVRASVQFRRGFPRTELVKLLEQLGAKMLSGGDESGIGTIEIRADQLKALADSRAVDYVDVGGRMAPFIAD